MHITLWIGCMFIIGPILVSHSGVQCASISERSTDHGKKVVRHGDELFLVDADDNNDDNENDRRNDQKRSAGSKKKVVLVDDDDDNNDDSGDNGSNNHHDDKRSTYPKKEVIRMGNDVIVLRDDSDDDSDNNGGDGGHKAPIHKRSAIKDESYRWKHKTVPYTFDSTFGAKDQGIVRSAMDEWERHTCLKFRPARPSDSNKVRFVQGDGCFSFVGMVEKTQDISLDKDGCRYVDTALHEIGHALGMYHTQVRPDRDQYVKIDLSDVKNNLKDNFIKQTWANVHHYGVKYDFRSIMHYDGTSFTSNGGTSIKTLDPKWQKIIGKVKHLSFGDIEMMNKMYHCAPQNCRLKDSDCPGISFVDKTCKCVCPGPDDKTPVVPCSGGSSGGGSSSRSSNGNSNKNNSNNNRNNSNNNRNNNNMNNNNNNNWNNNNNNNWNNNNNNNYNNNNNNYNQGGGSFYGGDSSEDWEYGDGSDDGGYEYYRRK